MASSFPPSQCQLQWRSAQEVSHCLHPPTGSRAGEGVPFQPLPDPAQAGGDRAHNVPIRAPGQDLVSEPEDEVEKGAQASQHQDPLLQLGLVFSLRGPTAAAAADQNRPAACPHAVHRGSIVHERTPIPEKKIQTEMANNTSGIRWTDFQYFTHVVLSLSPCLCHWAPVTSFVPFPLCGHPLHISLKFTFNCHGGN